uniref:MARVEL domain-containing protein n=1 Tax=Ixodes ricinus TaxID=34613 RepID=A0A147BF24_IXORI
MDLNFRVLKEPRGFMRVLQFVFAIFAFATTSGFGSATTFKVLCPEAESPVTVNFQFGYPFRMSYFPFKAPAKCPAGDPKDWPAVRLPFNFASNAEFFVATGVLSFLYCVGILGIYLFSNKMYIENQTVPIIDLGLSALLALFWFAGSCAWAQGKSDVKYYTSLPNFKNFVDVCKYDEKNVRTRNNRKFCHPQRFAHLGLLQCPPLGGRLLVRLQGDLLPRSAPTSSSWGRRGSPVPPVERAVPPTVTSPHPKPHLRNPVLSPRLSSSRRQAAE